MTNFSNLPASALEKFRRLETARDAAQTATISERDDDRFHQACRERDKVAAWLRDHSRDPRLAGEVAKAEAELVSLNEEVARLGAARDQAVERRRQAENLVANLKGFIARNCAQPVKAWSGKLPTPKAGETPAATVERVRAQIAKLKPELDALTDGRVSHGEAVEAWRKQVLAMAAQGRPPGLTKLLQGRQAPLPQTVTFENLAWVFADELIAAGEKFVKATGAAGVGPASRETRIAELDSEILLLERIEEMAIENGGLPMRPDADPRAVLGLGDDMPRPTAR